MPFAMLSNAQIDRFHTEGFLIVENLLDAALVDRLAARVEPLFNGEFETGVYPDEWYWNPRLGLPSASGQMSNVWKSDRTLASVVLSEKIGEICARLGGWSGTRLLSDSLWRKPFGASETTHHQDSMYSFYHQPQEIVVCWIALSHAVPQGSSIEYVRVRIAGRCRKRWRNFTPEAAAIAPDMEQAAKQAGIDRPDVVQLALEPGSCAFHHGHMWHGSGKNLLPNSIRRSLVIAHIPAESQFKPTGAYVEGGYLAGRYKRFGDDTMDESFFPIVHQQTAIDRRFSMPTAAMRSGQWFPDESDRTFCGSDRAIPRAGISGAREIP
ncbi:MAG: phytanoyl-CoA dioxygenase family protein [Leptolyngbyaceae cyanobacterium SM1_3_5]|nr:phytanoyl-CoA dioxygenase family protein [Leptolyngbyaceae cyanobacterium SM1_3_5]